MHVKSIGIVGQGHFGAFVVTLVERFLPEVEVRTVRARSTVAVEWAQVARADVVVLCVSIRHYIAIAERLLPLIGPETTIVDVATVKSLTTAWFQKQSRSVRYLCTHPMFGPASYEKSGQSVAGFRVVVTDHNVPADTYEAILTWLQGLGLHIIEMEATAHDRYLAETLFLTHFLAQVITKAEFVRTDIDTVSFGFLMDAVESVRDDTELFTDVYQHNPYCAAVIDKLVSATQHVQQQLLQSGSA